jgi:hypothetical protein
MASVNRAFAKALAGKASADGCVMVWERGDDGRQRQRLTCFVTVGNEQKTLTTLVDGRADLVAAAEKLAADFATDQGIKAPARELWDAQAAGRGRQ